MKYFKKNEKAEIGDNSVSLLNQGLVFKNSQISGCGSIKISCLIEGDLDIEGDVHVLDCGIVKGNITCTNIIVEGSVSGDKVNAAQTITINNGGSIVSNISCSGFNVSDNSIFNGTCNMKANRKSIVELKKEEVSQQA